VEAWTPDFTWIIPRLAVGGAFPVEHAACLVADHGIGAVIDVRSEARDDPRILEMCGLKFLHLPTEDMAGVSQPLLDDGVAFARAAMDDGLRVLVHCRHGIGRSALVALCVLVAQGHPPLDALSRIKDMRLVVSPSEAQYRAWAVWMERRLQLTPPSYHEFGVIAYRHLAQSA
jgi:protein-tyrosine phosphatase